MAGEVDQTSDPTGKSFKNYVESLDVVIKKRKKEKSRKKRYVEVLRKENK